MTPEEPRPVPHSLITQQRHLVTEFAFCLGEISTTIRVRVYRQLANQRYSAEQSHYIQTPLQKEPAFESGDEHASLDACLTAIADIMVEQYQHAEQAGHRPSENWLLPSRDFD